MALTAACLGVLLLAVVWYAAHYIPFARHADASVLSGFIGLERPGLDRLTRAIARLCDPGPFVVLAAVPVIVAFARGRPRLAITIAVILLCANETTELLKPLLAGPRDPVPGDFVSAASWPSGHATAAMSLCLCSVIAVSSRWRPAVAAVMAGFAVAVSYSFLELGWHYPSDVLGGFLVATVWTLLAITGLAIYERRHASSGSVTSARFSVAQALGPVAVVATGAIVLALLLVLAHPHGAVSYAHGHKWFVIGACAIGLLGFALASGVMLMLRATGGTHRPDPVRGSPAQPASQR
jgi:membrane-associated phospholipid phosphatase